MATANPQVTKSASPRSIESNSSAPPHADPRRARWALIFLAITATAGGLFFGWGWLVAIGLAPILVTLAPCLVMCALGVCMAGRGGGGIAKDPTIPEANQ